MLYTTLKKLKDYIGEDNPEKEQEVKQLLENATILLDTEIGQNLQESSFTRRID